jgi:cGMP-dependent protein kinase
MYIIKDGQVTCTQSG